MDLVSGIIRLYNQQALGRILEPEKICLDFYKVDIPRNKLEDLERGTLSDEDCLIRADDVGDYWPENEQIQRRNVQIVITIDDTVLPRRPSAERVSQTSSALDQLTLRQDETAEAFRNAASASTAAQYSLFAKQQERRSNPIYNGRPYRLTGIPVQLFHPVFDYFATQLEQTSALSPTKYAAVENFLFASQDLYSSESIRWSCIQGLLTAAIGHPISKDAIHNCQSNGVVIFTEKDSACKAYGVIIVLKNEIGTGHSDPWIQGAQSFARYWSQLQMAGLRRATRCPTFIISIAGPWMCVSGAVYLDHVVAQPLTDYMWLGQHPQQDHYLVRMTRVFEAIYEAVSSLKEYYRPFIGPHAHLPIEHARAYPYVQWFQSSEGPINFTYEDKIGGSGVIRPLFRAVTEDGRKIVVKFAEFYDFEAHKLLADRSLAPKLLSLCAERVSQGLLMIVMELSGTSLDNFLPPTQSGLPPTACAQIESDVRKALDILHENNLVFGDLRPPNVLVVPASDGSLCGKLIDFEWCGIEGKARYPAGMNQYSTSIKWAVGAAKGALLSREHDNQMFETLFSPPDLGLST